MAYESYSEHIYEPPLWLSSKESACNARDVVDMGSIPESGRSPGGGNSNVLQYSSQENTMDREARWATVHGVAESDITEHSAWHSTWQISSSDRLLASSFCQHITDWGIFVETNACGCNKHPINNVLMVSLSLFFNVIRNLNMRPTLLTNL